MTAITVNRWAATADAVAYYRHAIDLFAGEVRARFAFSHAIDEEYQHTARQAEAYVEAGYTGTPGETVQAWADATGNSAQWAADDILATRDAYLTALEGVRRIRLVAKAQMVGAADARAVKAIHDGARDQLDAITPPQ